MNVTKEQLRDFYINYHGFNEFYELDGQAAVTAVFDRIRSVQFDPLDITGRNAELVLFSRNRNVTRDDLFDALYKSRTLVDGWDKMMCIYKTSDFTKFKYLRNADVEFYKQVMAWRRQDACHNFTEEIYSYIKDHGDTLVTDIPSAGTGDGGWGPKKVAGVCCELLFHGGRIVVSRKKGVVKAYDITERAIGVDPEENAFGTEREFLRWYVKRRISALGAARRANGSAWLGLFLENNELREDIINELIERGEVKTVKVEGDKSEFCIVAGDEKYFQAATNERATFIAPLDNLIWDRKAVANVFGFDYSWEVYTPPAKRKFGYYVLPILIGNRFVGRIEPVLDRKAKALNVKNVWFENDYQRNAEDNEKIKSELLRLAKFLNAELDKAALNLI